MINKIEHLKKFLKKKPVIAAFRNKQDMKKALKSDAIALFVLGGDISDLPQVMDQAKENDKLVFLHIDLIKGIAADKAGLTYLADNNLCDGIVTTRSNLVKKAQKLGLMAIQRLFLLDSAALHSGENMIKNNNPDAIEILPGIAAPYFLDHMSKKKQCPVIAGGLIREEKEVEDLLQKGVLAVSSSEASLW